MNFNKNLEEIENLIAQARKRNMLQEGEKQHEGIKNTYCFSVSKQQEIKESAELSEEQNNAYVQHLLEQGKIRNQIKLAPPIGVNKEN